MGASPHTPLLISKNWIAGKAGSHGGWKRESICPLANMIRKQGKHVLREHVLTDKLTSGFACGDGRFHHSTNRAERRERR